MYVHRLTLINTYFTPCTDNNKVTVTAKTYKNGDIPCIQDLYINLRTLQSSNTYIFIISRSTHSPLTAIVGFIKRHN